MEDRNDPHDQKAQSYFPIQHRVQVAGSFPVRSPLERSSTVDRLKAKSNAIQSCSKRKVALCTRTCSLPRQWLVRGTLSQRGSCEWSGLRAPVRMSLAGKIWMLLSTVESSQAAPGMTIGAKSARGRGVGHQAHPS